LCQLLFFFFVLVISAHKCLKGATTEAKTQDVSRPAIPLTDAKDIREDLPNMVQSTLQQLQSDPFHKLSRSSMGKTIIDISSKLATANLATLHILLISHIMQIFASTPDINFTGLHKLRTNQEFLEGFMDVIFLSGNFELPLNFARLYVQRFVTCFVAVYLKRQVELLNVNTQRLIQSITENDKQVLFYVSGFIFHSLRKRYIKAKSKSDELTHLIQNLKDDGNNSDYSKWTVTLNRGGLQKPSHKFVQFIFQVERWVRDMAPTNANLKADSFMDLQENLMSYSLLRHSWEKIVTDKSEHKFLILDHVLGLFLKIRGFAVTKLLRKQLQQKRKASKHVAGSRKALRKELKRT